MSVREVRSSVGSDRAKRERLNLLVLAGLIVTGVGFYIALRASGNSADSQRNLLPYQMLIRALPDADQQMYTALRLGLADMEADRSRLAGWPEVTALAAQGVGPFGSSEGQIRWQRFQQSATVNYVGIPADPSAPAWLLAIQEPEPNTPPDPAPLDDEHHRLPDGTTLHIYVWMHRYGGRLAPGFVPQPQTAGWTELFATPPNPLPPPRK